MKEIDAINESEGEEEMFGAGGKTPKVNIPKGKTLKNGTVSFKSYAKPGPAGSGQARNDRIKGRHNK